MRLEVKVQPRSKREEIAGWIGDALKVRVQAPPERGRANEAVRAVLADALAVATSEVRLVSGAASSRKVFEVEGLDDGEARRRIGARLVGAGRGG